MALSARGDMAVLIQDAKSFRANFSCNMLTHLTSLVCLSLFLSLSLLTRLQYFKLRNPRSSAQSDALAQISSMQQLPLLR